MLGAVRIDIGKLAESVRGIRRRDKPTFEVQRFPLRVEGISIADVEVNTRCGSLWIVFRPLAQMQGDGTAISEPVPLGTFIFMDVETETPVAVEGRIEVEGLARWEQPW